MQAATLSLLPPQLHFATRQIACRPHSKRRRPPSSSSPTSRWRTTSSTARIQAVRDELGPAAADPGPSLSAGRSDRPGRPARATATGSARRRPRAATAAASPSAASTSWPRRPTSWPTGPRSWPSAAASACPSSCPTWRPAARWPTWPAIDQIEDAWDQLGEVIDTEDITPVTYINSAASLKAFVGRHGGIVCTSSQRRGGARVVVRAHQPRDVLPRSAPGPQHGARHGHHARPDAGLGSVRRRARRQHRRAARAAAK